MVKKLTFKQRVDKKFKREVFQLLYKIFSIMPIKKKKIAILSDSRASLSDNFRFVYEELQKRDNYDYFFLLKPSVKTRKRYIEIIKLAYHIATAKVILVDDYYPMVYPLKIRKNADLIQIWHAVGAFKTFGFSRSGKPGGPKPTSIAHKNYTKAIVSSKYVAPFYAEGFGITEDKVVATGIPRTDIFFDEQYKENKYAEMMTKFPEFEGKHITLYAPTFRGHGQSSAVFPQKKLELAKIYDSLGEQDLFLIKMHPFVSKKFKIPAQYKDKIIDMTKYPSVNDLLFISDILITDYSSVCFEYALLNKPMIFYCFDLEEYVSSRDFYIPYEQFTPGEIVYNTEELIDVMQKKTIDHSVDYSEFTTRFFDDLDGKSTERVADLIVSCMHERK
ncbi:CDP-glycerol glycerophosphotransferase family protein [Kurthia sibirica]|uniref:CDP-glycerol--glycerophosphate glycerophosphotransferase n=1 Tax=Kurthia sibirica TaxID=202750 RepID=A0A2U3AKX9_9BACL|nr:CDP-glycerol glycerophosphotransferase family protein [Kurthia sibirica]PWI25206.1 CDP-glycerol--glycerophosphate glycerophosphotransferase [Kurthia sibirica]GEK35190.1 hypothetical protein KSI01_27230 [Kurthia sibirica]